VRDPEWLSEEEQRLWRAFLAASSGLTLKLDAQLKAACGMAIDDYEVLVHLSEAPQRRVRMRELADLMLHSRSRLTQRVDRLVKRGFVQREKCDDDARGTWAVLTTNGHSALESAAPHHVEHVRQHMFGHLDAAQVPLLMDSFERLAEGVRE